MGAGLEQGMESEGKVWGCSHLVNTVGKTQLGPTDTNADVFSDEYF